MNLGACWPWSLNISCVPKDVYKNNITYLVFHTYIGFQFINSFEKYKLCNAIPVWLKVQNIMYNISVKHKVWVQCAGVFKWRK